MEQIEKNEVIDNLRQLRTEMHHVREEALSHIGNTRFVNLTKTSFDLARMWTGKLIGELCPPRQEGEPGVYSEAKDVNSVYIDKALDVDTSGFPQPYDPSETLLVIRVKITRELIYKLIGVFAEQASHLGGGLWTSTWNPKNGLTEVMCWEQVFLNLHNCVMFLGMELEDMASDKRGGAKFVAQPTKQPPVEAEEPLGSGGPAPAEEPGKSEPVASSSTTEDFPSSTSASDPSSSESGPTDENSSPNMNESESSENGSSESTETSKPTSPTPEPGKSEAETSGTDTSKSESETPTLDSSSENASTENGRPIVDGDKTTGEEIERLENPVNGDPAADRLWLNQLREQDKKLFGTATEAQLQPTEEGAPLIPTTTTTTLSETSPTPSSSSETESSSEPSATESLSPTRLTQESGSPAAAVREETSAENSSSAQEPTALNLTVSPSASSSQPTKEPTAKAKKAPAGKKKAGEE